MSGQGFWDTNEIEPVEGVCSGMWLKLSLYTDGELSDNEANEVESHAHRCDRCKEALVFMKATSASTLPQLDPPTELRSRILAATTRKGSIWAQRIQPSRPIRLAYGVCAIAGFAALFFITTHFQSEKPKTASVVHHQISKQPESINTKTIATRPTMQQDAQAPHTIRHFGLKVAFAPSTTLSNIDLGKSYLPKDVEIKPNISNTARQPLNAPEASISKVEPSPTNETPDEVNITPDPKATILARSPSLPHTRMVMSAGSSEGLESLMTPGNKLDEIRDRSAHSSLELNAMTPEGIEQVKGIEFKRDERHNRSARSDAEKQIDVAVFKVKL
jgi:hypothetical protein